MGETQVQGANLEERLVKESGRPAVMTCESSRGYTGSSDTAIISAQAGLINLLKMGPSRCTSVWRSKAKRRWSASACTRGLLPPCLEVQLHPSLLLRSPLLPAPASSSSFRPQFIHTPLGLRGSVPHAIFSARKLLLFHLQASPSGKGNDSHQNGLPSVSALNTHS